MLMHCEMMPVREYLDFRVEIFSVHAAEWAVHASCPLGETRSTTAVPIDRARIDQLVAELDARTISAGACFELGTLLGGLLLPGEVLDLFRAAFPANTDPSQGIRLRLIIRDSWAASLPWELAHVPLTAAGESTPYLAVHPAVSVLRHEALPAPQPMLEATEGPLRVLCASARQLPGLDPLNATDLAQPALTSLAALHVEQLPDPVSAPSLEEALCTPWDVFHFAGHSLRRPRIDGTQMAGLAIADDRGGNALLSADRLALLLQAAKVKIAVLGTCNPNQGLGEHRLALGTFLVEAGIPAVVIMQFPVEDSHAAAFSLAFYRALAAGASLDESVADGRRKILELGILTDWAAPVTFCRSTRDTFFTRRRETASSHTPSYRAGHAGTGPSEDTQAWDVLRRLCEQWEPSASVDERTEITRLTTLRRATTGPNSAHVSALVKTLGEAYPAAVPENELRTKLHLLDRRKLAVLVREANHNLEEENRNELSRFIIAGPRPAEASYCLQRRPVADLIERSPTAHGKLDYHLRLAFGLYDVGDYKQSTAHLIDRLESSHRNKGLLTVPEHALLFYYLSKSLLKLNRYSELLAVLEGPYRKLSHSVLADLEVERLHVAGVRHRHLGELSPAQTCFERAIGTLKVTPAAAREPAVLSSLGDSWVLLAQCRLEQALDHSVPLIVREAALASAEDALYKGTAQFTELRRITGVATHYEGRLNGTHAYTTLVSSLIRVNSVTAAMWDQALRFAEAGFTPERDRKPFGIVAGKFALSSVLLACARWHCLAKDGSGSTQARAHIAQALTLLKSLRTDHMEGRRVHLGPQFEIPKIELATRTANELAARQDISSTDLWHEMASREAVWSPLV
ncbi:CHAT domain-containing protein [Streptomyces sp. NPDC127066]|uniref:CHAT domain-containing protein n=1 Tax=Streptomyces sp. NPDC127066 TaxID=3347125 RepID=UPI00364C36DC